MKKCLDGSRLQAMNKVIILTCVFVAVLGAPINYNKVHELIIGGHVTRIENCPYQVALLYQNMFFCSGTILSPTHIVTAAHCISFFPTGSPELSVRAGSTDATKGGQTIQVKEVYKHPKYSTRKVDYDVAVVELVGPLRFDSKTRALKLADKEPLEGDEVKVSGWGYQEEKGPPSRMLQSVSVKIVDRNTCAKNYEKSFKVTERMLCASKKDKDACYGDSGGPLIHQGKLIGIVSSGEGCARSEYPGIYTNIPNPEVKEFIKKITNLQD